MEMSTSKVSEDTYQEPKTDDEIVESVKKEVIKLHQQYKEEIKREINDLNNQILIEKEKLYKSIEIEIKTELRGELESIIRKRMKDIEYELEEIDEKATQQLITTNFIKEVDYKATSSTIGNVMSKKSKEHELRVHSIQKRLTLLIYLTVTPLVLMLMGNMALLSLMGEAPNHPLSLMSTSIICFTISGYMFKLYLKDKSHLELLEKDHVKSMEELSNILILSVSTEKLEDIKRFEEFLTSFKQKQENKQLRFI